MLFLVVIASFGGIFGQVIANPSIRSVNNASDVNWQCAPFLPWKSCPSGNICCDFTCVDSTTVINCGSCRNACSGLTPDCCTGTCADLDFNTNNCGACGTSCATGEGCCFGNCVDFNTDRDHCGDCKTVCGEKQECAMGECQDCPGDTYFCPPSGSCCTNGDVCIMTFQAPAATPQCCPLAHVCSPENNVKAPNICCPVACTVDANPAVPNKCPGY